MRETCEKSIQKQQEAQLRYSFYGYNFAARLMVRGGLH